MRFAKRDHELEESVNITVRYQQIPVQPGGFIVLIKGIVVAFLRVHELIACSEHGCAVAKKQDRAEILDLLFAEGEHVRRHILIAFPSAVPAQVIVRPVGIVQAVCLVVLGVISRCGSGGGLEHTGQHFTGGEQATAMLPDTLDDAVGTVRVEVADGVFDQMDAVVAQDQAAARAIDTDFRDHTVKNDLAVAQQFQKKIRVGIREHVNGLLLEDDLRIAAEVPGQIDLAVWNGEVVREEGTLYLFLSRGAGEAMGRILVEFGIGLEVGVGRGDDRDAMLDGEGGQTPKVRDYCFGAGHIEFPGRMHEVELRVDVPKEQARRHGRDLGGASLFQLHSFGTVVTRD